MPIDKSPQLIITMLDYPDVQLAFKGSEKGKVKLSNVLLEFDSFVLHQYANKLGFYQDEQLHHIRKKYPGAKLPGDSRPYPRGADLVMNGLCPINAYSQMGCMFCQFGHLTECHFPYDCTLAGCSHLKQYGGYDIEDENYD